MYFKNGVEAVGGKMTLQSQTFPEAQRPESPSAPSRIRTNGRPPFTAVIKDAHAVGWTAKGRSCSC